MPLEPADARKVYDRIGRLQSTQSFYEGAPIAAMKAAGRFGSAHAVFELGCGTGELAADLLDHHLPADVDYVGVDVSPRMVAIASGRMGRWADRASVTRIDGRPPFDQPPSSFDRFVATYVFDLLPERDIQAMLAEFSPCDEGGFLAAGRTHLR